MGLFNRKKKNQDTESTAEVKAEKVDKYSSGDEYQNLLLYVSDSAQNAKDAQEAGAEADLDPDSDEARGYRRNWYFKKIPLEARKKAIPEDWFKTDSRNGLNDGDIEERRKSEGFNELESPYENQWLKFISYFQGPILYVMEVAVVLAAGLTDWVDFGVIIAILLMNAVVGWYQEKNASDIVAKLKEGIALKATVIRNGKESEIEARDLVVGDILVLDEGTVIPADAKILGPYESRSSFNSGNNKSGNGAPLHPVKSSRSGSQKRVQPPSLPYDSSAAPRTDVTQPGHPNQIHQQDGLATRQEDISHEHDNDGISGNGNGDRSTSGSSSTAGSDGGIKSTHSPDRHLSAKPLHHDGNGDEEDDDEDEAAERKKGPSIISVDQSAITGESLAVEKYVGEIAYYTCGVKRGKCLAVVTTSAKGSFVGKTAGLVLGSNEKGHFQIILGQIGTSLLVTALVFIFIVWVGGFFRGIAISEPKENSLLVYTLIFLIIGVPVGLPVVTTTTMAVGSAYLARRKCIVQKLTAIEALAGVDILCSDKTGTLTANKLSLNEPYLAEGVDRDWFMTVAVLASSHNIKSLDPIDKVTILALRDYPRAQENLRSGWKTSNFSPFDPVSKRITAEVEKDGKRYTACKGAPNSILKLKTFDPEVVQHYRDQASIFAKRGYRSLGVAIKEDGKDWELLGIMSMSDPPRSDTATTIAEAQRLGLNIKMLTGDAVAIAKELARQLHLGTNIYDSEKLIGGDMAGSDALDFVEQCNGLAEVFPEHKYSAVKMLQSRGHLVAMTGDGVNDAPSLKAADCGIAVHGASSAAQSAADVVFVREGLSNIIIALKLARSIFHRMKAYIIYRIALCIHLEVYLMLSILILNETIRADLIVFLALFADVATVAIAYDNAPVADKPVEWQLPKVVIISTIMGLLLAAGTWITRATMFLSNQGIIQNHGTVQEVLFLQVALTESWLIFITRISQTSGDKFVWPSYQLVLAVFGVDILASLFTLFNWFSSGPEIGGSNHSGTSIVTVIRVWALSFGIIVVITFVYIALNKISYLDNLGKKNRSHKNSRMENFMAEMAKMTLIHERDSETQNDVYRFSTPGSKKSVETEEEKSIDKKDKKGGKDEKKKE